MATVKDPLVNISGMIDLHISKPESGSRHSRDRGIHPTRNIEGSHSALYVPRTEIVGSQLRVPAKALNPQSSLGLKARACP